MRTTALILALLCGVAMAADLQLDQYGIEWVPEGAMPPTEYRFDDQSTLILDYPENFWLGPPVPLFSEVSASCEVAVETPSGYWPCLRDDDCLQLCWWLGRHYPNVTLERATATGTECRCEWRTRSGQRGVTTATCRKVAKPVKP